MKIGIVAATHFEISPVIDFIAELPAASPHQFSILVTGVGMLAATYHLTEQLLQKRYDYLLQAGIGGCFANRFALTDVVMIEEEVVGDLGVQEKEFRDVFDMGFAKAGQFPFTGRSLINPYLDQWKHFQLPVAKGLTVNEITTDSRRIQTLTTKYGSSIESMEGAAFHYVCLQQDIPFLQIRSVSNAVGERDKTKWRLHESIQTLNIRLIEIIQQLNLQ